MRASLTVLLLLVNAAALATDVVAHRGYGCGADDNSLQSIRNAWAAGADAVELDVRVSSDGIAYLFHDDEIDGLVVDGMSYADIDARTARPLVPVSELSATPAPDNYYLFDLKSINTESLAVVLDAVVRSGINFSQTAFQSDRLAVLDVVSQVQPGSKTYFLSRSDWRVPYLVPASARALARKLRGHAIDGVSVKGRSFIGDNYVGVLKSAGLKVNVWTINEPERISHYRDAGVDAIITDEVSLVRGAPSSCIQQ